MSGRKLRVLVVDDELLARQRLEDLLARMEGVAEVLTAESGRAAVQAVEEQRPDLLFLDMQMPGMSGLDVIRQVGPDALPVTVFVTAHDQYALQAFEVAALDYLLKPFDDGRFRQAFNRAVRQLELKRAGTATDRIVDLLEGRGSVGRDGERVATERIAVESGGTTHLVPIASVSHVTAAGPYSELHAEDRTYLIRETMQSLEERLAPYGFLRVHRSSIIRLDRVQAVERGSGGDYSVRLAGGVDISVSRARMSELEQKLGVER